MPSTPTDSPEELRVLDRIDRHALTVGEHKLGSDQIVYCKTELWAEWAVTSAQGKANHADRGDCGRNGSEPERSRDCKDVSNGCASLDRRNPSF